MLWAIVGLALAGQSSIACQAPPAREWHASGPLLVSAAHSPIYAYFPDLDHRIARMDPRAGRVQQTFYFDAWYPGLTVVRDFAVDDRRLYALLGGRRDLDDRRLFAVTLEDGKRAQTAVLPPMPQVLAWSAPGRLLVGHGTGHVGAVGRLTQVEAERLEVGGSVELAGACAAIAPVADGKSAYVLELTTLDLGEQGSVGRAALADVDLVEQRVRRRMALPGGARQLTLGPTGLLYASQASGVGRLETDGTVTVIDPRAWRIVDRLRQDMIVRSMRADGEHLALNMLSTSGETWVSLLDRAHRTVYDTQLETLVGPDLALAGGRAYVAPRRGSELVWIDTRARRRGGRWKLGRTPGVDDRPSLLRTRIEVIDAP